MIGTAARRLEGQMNMIRRRLARLIVALAWATSAHAIDMQKSTQETQRVSQSAEQVTIVWWMPQVFWEASMDRNAALTPKPYPSKRGDKRLLDPRKPGAFSYSLYDATFTWRLPLASLLPAKVDAKTGQEFPGNYLFNPYTGAPLVAK
jgi:hypothetical protein